MSRNPRGGDLHKNPKIGDLSEAVLEQCLRSFVEANVTVLELAAAVHWLTEVEGRNDWQEVLYRHKGPKAAGDRPYRARDLLREVDLRPAVADANGWSQPTLRQEDEKAHPCAWETGFATRPTEHRRVGRSRVRHQGDPERSAGKQIPARRTGLPATIVRGRDSSSDVRPLCAACRSRVHEQACTRELAAQCRSRYTVLLRPTSFHRADDMIARDLT